MSNGLTKFMTMPVYVSSSISEHQIYLSAIYFLQRIILLKSFCSAYIQGSLVLLLKQPNVFPVNKPIAHSIKLSFILASFMTSWLVAVKFLFEKMTPCMLGHF